jgi:cation diffusion facilitator CzcD-associated flavoprotein CzcO
MATEDAPPPHPNEYYQKQKTQYDIQEQPLGTMRSVRIVTIGAGASGINMIRTLKLNTSNFEHVVYEKNHDIGGTWYENRYPGCRCDIPSHNYQFSHTPNHGWRALFSEAGEIQSYLQHVCDTHDLRGSIKLSHSVLHAKWDEGKGEWLLKVKNEDTGDVFEDRCNFLLDASGILKCVNLPATRMRADHPVSGNGLILKV